MNEKKDLQVQKGHGHHPVSVWDAMNRFFDDSWHPFGSFFEEPALKKLNEHALDVSETDKAIKVTIDVPGYNPYDINVEIDDNNVLNISGETKEEKEEKDEKFYRKERSSGHFLRSIALPSYIDADEATCKAKNGSLEIIIPKTEESGKKSIKVDIE
jgi:HSP20 family protein